MKNILANVVGFVGAVAVIVAGVAAVGALAVGLGHGFYWFYSLMIDNRLSELFTACSTMAVLGGIGFIVYNRINNYMIEKENDDNETT